MNRTIMTSRTERLNKTGSLIAQAFIFAKAGDIHNAGRHLVLACKDEELFDEVSSAVADGVEEAIMESTEVQANVQQEELEEFEEVISSSYDEYSEEVPVIFEADDENEEDDEEELIESKYGCCGSTEKEEKQPAVKEEQSVTASTVNIPSSVIRLANRLKNNKY